jgi:hypothetical protein
MLVTVTIMEQVVIVGWLSPTILSLDKQSTSSVINRVVTQILIACLCPERSQFNEGMNHSGLVPASSIVAPSLEGYSATMASQNLCDCEHKKNTTIQITPKYGFMT